MMLLLCVCLISSVGLKKHIQLDNWQSRLMENMINFNPRVKSHSKLFNCSVISRPNNSVSLCFSSLNRERQKSTGGNSLTFWAKCLQAGLFVLGVFLLFFLVSLATVFVIIWLMISQGFILAFSPFDLYLFAVQPSPLAEHKGLYMCCWLNSRWNLTTFPLDDICCYFICQFCLLAFRNHVCVRLQTQQPKHTSLNNDLSLSPATLSVPGVLSPEETTLSQDTLGWGGTTADDGVSVCLWQKLWQLSSCEEGGQEVLQSI